MDLLPVLGAALASAILCLLLRQYRPEYALLVSLACGVLLFLMILSSLKPVMDTIDQLASRLSLDPVYGKTLLKALGICYLVQLASDSCKDAGQAAIASKVELAGKVSLVLLSLPLFQKLAQTALTLISL